MNRIISSKNAPKAIGPYSQAIQSDDFLFVSGQLPIDPVTGIMSDDVSLETKQSLENIKAIVLEAGFKLTDIVKCTVYLQNMNDFTAMNMVYENFFGSHHPARVAVEVAKLPKNALVEIDAICHK